MYTPMQTVAMAAMIQQTNQFGTSCEYEQSSSKEEEILHEPKKAKVEVGAKVEVEAKVGVEAKVQVEAKVEVDPPGRGEYVLPVGQQGDRLLTYS